MREVNLQIEKLSIGYGKFAVDECIVGKNLNGSLLAGELTCLLGANGVGKSTLLRTLSGFQPYLRGAVKILGKELTTYSIEERAKLISVVLTERIDLENFTVKELIALGRSPFTNFWGRLSPGDEEDICGAMELVHITHLKERMVNSLSDGERQKCFIAKALVQETPFIFLDEPTAFLDYPSKVEMMQLLHLLSRETGKTIFLSTHDLELALQLADKLWLLAPEGLTIGAPEDLALDGSLERAFAHQGVWFDSESGLFKVKHRLTEKIQLLGDRAKQSLIRSALARVGVEVVAKKTEWWIEVVEENNQKVAFILSNGKEKLHFNSVESLVHKVELLVKN